MALPAATRADVRALPAAAVPPCTACLRLRLVPLDKQQGGIVLGAEGSVHQRALPLALCSRCSGRKVALQVAAGVTYLHQQHIIHME